MEEMATKISEERGREERMGKGGGGGSDRLEDQVQS